MSILFHKKSACKRSKGITLTELLVASVMIGVVMLGVAAFGVAIKSLQGSTNKSVIIALRTKSVMARIAADATLAVGYMGNRGVNTNTTEPHFSICFRQDDDNTPDIYTDDVGICYYRNNAANNLMLCGQRAWANTPVTTDGGGATGCSTGGDQQLMELDPGNNIFFQVVDPVGTGPLQFITISISTIFNTALAVDPVTNPQYTTTTQVSPIGHSR